MSRESLVRGQQNRGSTVPHACPCGYHGDPKRECRCTHYQILRCMSRVSGPLLDRIEMVLDNGRADGWMSGWVEEWMGGRLDEWMGGWVEG